MLHSPVPWYSRLLRVGLALACVGLLGLTLAATTEAVGTAAAPQGQSSDRDVRPERIFSVTHPSVATVLVTAGSQGHQLGDLRVLPATPVANSTGSVVGRLDAQLLTTSVDYPVIGDEVRMSTLNFVFGQGSANLAGSADQLLVSGSGYYPGNQSTIPAGDALIRPITGGSGAYAGASGWAKTEHLLDGSWRHTFYLLPVPRR